MPNELKKRLYMFAFMPPADLSAEIENVRLDFANKYNCKAALKPPVHITAYSPFWNTEDLPERVKGLHEWACLRAPVKAELKDFGWFENPRSPVIYIHVERTKELADLHVSFLARLKKDLPEVVVMRGYKPHITIGYRDISPEIFPEIRADYSTRTFDATFEIRSLFLWEHDRKKWNVVDEYKLTSHTSPMKSVQSSLF